MPWEGPEAREHMLSGRQFETVKKAYGAGDPDVLFKGAPKTTAAWPGSREEQGPVAHQPGPDP